MRGKKIDWTTNDNALYETTSQFTNLIIWKRNFIN